ncbi:MAG: M14 family metallopeptidase [Acidobacteriota bacterium]|nr:M14 family metallopeptidase [Acidobacteriota bacterium]
MFKNKSFSPVSFFAALRLCGIIFLLAFSSFAQTKIPAPTESLGFTPGDDRKLASWSQIVEYFQKLDAASDRVRLQEIGKTTMNAPFVYATISAPENLKNLEKYKQINKKLADPRLIKSNDKAAQSLIKQGKTIVLITCGIHSTEVGSTLSSMLIAHKLATSNEPEIQKILQDTIILLVPSLNPDGVDIVKNWYDKTLGTPYEGTSPPELYLKYVGHDNNRDWYAFTQIETQLTVDKIHNEWHPQIVHDIHQQGERGARLFLPPYLAPVEPNVPKEIIEGYTELGNFMANDLRGKGFAGITTDSTYDAWTPARAYSHYHGGVRILSETASAKLATPTAVKFDDLRGSEGFDAKKKSPNFSPVWKGGAWHLRDITNYMTTAAFSLLKHSADNREAWLKRFYAIGKEAVRPRKDGEVYGYLVTPFVDLERILKTAKVEFKNEYRANDDGSTQEFLLIKAAQPYGNFAKALLEKQTYPNLKDEKGNPITPYDVTAHTISLLFDVDVEPVFAPLPRINVQSSIPSQLGCGSGKDGPKINKAQIYRSYIPSMDEGWTRFIFEDNENWRRYGKRCEKLTTSSIKNEEILKSNLSSTLIFPDQSPNQILNGYAKGSMPDEYTGGVGKEGVANLRKFVEAGGTLVFLNRASDFAIKQFDLPIKDVTDGLPRKDFFIPGSILRTELDTAHPIAKGMPAQSIAWFEDSPAFEITDNTNVKVIARYPQKSSDILLSGWALGAEKLAGKAALVEIKMGKGKIVLFGFRPQYRGQSLATFPLLFNAIGN